jgi:hypothetical protein
MEHIPAEFSGISLDIIERDGRRWLTAQQIGIALGFDESNARKGVLKLYERHGDEFTERDTFVVKLTTNSPGVVRLTTPGGNQVTRIFSESGCNKLGFFACTKRAKEFRTWAARALASPTLPVSPLPAVPVSLDQLSARLDNQGRGIADLAQAVTAVSALLDKKDQIIDRLQREADAARAAALRTRPDWAQVQRYATLGLSATESARLLCCGERTVRRIKKTLRESGLLPPLNPQTLVGAARRAALRSGSGTFPAIERIAP